jgi:hypothetical protein
MTELVCCGIPMQFFRETSRVSLSRGQYRIARTYSCGCCHKEQEHISEEFQRMVPLTLRTAHPIRAFTPFFTMS